MRLFRSRVPPPDVEAAVRDSLDALIALERADLDELRKRMDGARTTAGTIVAVVVAIVAATTAAIGATGGVDLPVGAGPHGQDFWLPAGLSAAALGLAALTSVVGRMPERRTKSGELIGWSERRWLRPTGIRAEVAADALKAADLRDPVAIRRAVLELTRARGISARTWVRRDELVVQGAIVFLYCGLIAWGFAAGAYAGV